MAEIVEVRREAVRADAVGPAFDLELEQAQFDPDLEHVPAVPGPDLPGDHLAGVGFIRPTLQGLVDIPAHRPLPRRPSEVGPTDPTIFDPVKNYSRTSGPRHEPRSGRGGRGVGEPGPVVS